MKRTHVIYAKVSEEAYEMLVTSSENNSRTIAATVDLLVKRGFATTQGKEEL